MFFNSLKFSFAVELSLHFFKFYLHFETTWYKLKHAIPHNLPTWLIPTTRYVCAHQHQRPAKSGESGPSGRKKRGDPNVAIVSNSTFSRRSQFERFGRRH
uniref:(northern house mosquito) hypothetical protein n=1 Tax=Culex pipiens TaxID=7175 RepID=A0A8D8G2U0_CULPI